MADCGDGVDRISSLPDGVLCCILGFLPILDAVRSCILSCRWGSLWRSVPCLNFEVDSRTIMDMVRGELKGTNNDDDDVDYIHSRYMLYSVGMKPDLINIISQVFHSHCGTIVESCYVKYYMQMDLNFGELVIWIEKLLKSKQIRKLTLRSFEEPSFIHRVPKEVYNLPSCLFSYESLHELELNGCLINNAASFQGCSNLSILSLKNMILNHEVLHEIISICSHLEKLILRRISNYIRNLKLMHDNLKVLDLGFLRLGTMEVISGSLNVLALSSISCQHWINLYTPNLQYYYLTDSQTKCGEYTKCADILEMCSGLCKKAHRPEFKNPFENLHTLSVVMNLKDLKQAFIMSYIFRVCFKLQTLYIKEDDELLARSSRILPYDELAFWERQDLYDSISHHLRKLEIKGFKGDVFEMTFVKYIITNACQMNRMVIQYADKCSKKGASSAFKILSFPNAAIDISLVLKPSPSYLAMEGGSFDSWVDGLN